VTITEPDYVDLFYVWQHRISMHLCRLHNSRERWVCPAMLLAYTEYRLMNIASYVSVAQRPNLVPSHGEHPCRAASENIKRQISEYMVFTVR